MRQFTQPKPVKSTSTGLPCAAAAAMPSSYDVYFGFTSFVLRLKSCVFIGGAKAPTALQGAPHRPGTMYIAKANDTRPSITQGTGIGLLSPITTSLWNFSLPIR